MHIAIDARIINSSTGRYIERLLTYLEKIDSPHTFSVLVREKDTEYWKPTNPRFSIVVADYHQYTFGEQLGFYFFLKQLNADLVHFCMPQQPFLYRGAKVTTVHDLSLLRITENDTMSLPVLKTKQFIFKHLLRSVIRSSRIILAPSEYTKDDILAFQPIDPARVIRTYESADAVSNTEEPVSEFISASFILAVGRADPYKNLRGAVEAHHILRQTHPDLQLIIVGKRDETSHQLEAWALQQGYDGIHFFGFASDAQLAWFYSHCQVYIFPSFMEGFGLPGLEAMRHGAPVASSNATCLPEIYGNAALYFDPQSPTAIASTVNEILDNPSVRDDLIDRGTKKVKEYSWQRMAEETLAAYNLALTKTVER